jgi:hypothetical protein
LYWFIKQAKPVLLTSTDVLHSLLLYLLLQLLDLFVQRVQCVGSAVQRAAAFPEKAKQRHKNLFEFNSNNPLVLFTDGGQLVLFVPVQAEQTSELVLTLFERGFE